MHLRFAFLGLAAVLAAPLDGWNAVGHKTVAGIAYDRLNGKARARVDDLIRRHPDYKMLIEGGPSGERDKARYAFMKASFWPDIIRGDARFYDDSRPGATPVSPAPGFADSRRRLNWHYINVAFSVDGTPANPAPEPNVLTQLKLILGAIANAPPANPGGAPAEQDPVYLLPWLLHLAGDVHQPLHCATRYRKGQVDPKTGNPWSDLGGNTVFVVGASNLHALWDDALGMVDSPTYIDGLIRAIRKVGEEDKVILDPERWVKEGSALAQSVVYSFGNEGGFKDSPIALEPGYIPRMRELARKRASLAGQRLAAVLNSRLK